VPYECCVDSGGGLPLTCPESLTGYKFPRRLWVQIQSIESSGGDCSACDTEFDAWPPHWMWYMPGGTPTIPGYSASTIVGSWFMLEYVDSPFLGFSSWWYGTRWGFPDYHGRNGFVANNNYCPVMALYCQGNPGGGESPKITIEMSWGSPERYPAPRPPVCDPPCPNGGNLWGWAYLDPMLGWITPSALVPSGSPAALAVSYAPVSGVWGPPGSMSQVVGGYINTSPFTSVGPSIGFSPPIGDRNFFAAGVSLIGDKLPCLVKFLVQDRPPGAGAYPDPTIVTAGTPVVKGWWVKKVKVTLPSGYYWAAPIPDCVDCTGSPVTGSGGDDVTNLVLSRAYAPAWMLAESDPMTTLNPTACCGSGSGSGGGDGCPCPGPTAGRTSTLYVPAALTAAWATSGSVLVWTSGAWSVEYDPATCQYALTGPGIGPVSPSSVDCSSSPTYVNWFQVALLEL
jgi:hypothetical protein